MNIDVGKLIANVSQIKLKGGIFTKASTLLIIACICIFGIAAITRNLWISAAAIGLIFILVFVMLWRLINFANKNPQAAILEGAEFLVHEQIQLAAKGITSIPQSFSTLMEETPIEVDVESLQLANQPDEENELKEVDNE